MSNALHPSDRKQKQRRQTAEAISHTDIKRQARNAPQSAEQCRERAELTEEEKSLSCQIPCLGGDCASPQEEQEEEGGRDGGMGWDGP